MGAELAFAGAEVVDASITAATGLVGPRGGKLRAPPPLNCKSVCTEAGSVPLFMDEPNSRRTALTRGGSFPIKIDQGINRTISVLRRAARRERLKQRESQEEHVKSTQD